MKYKKNVSDYLDSLRTTLTNTKYHVSTGGSFEDILASFQKCYEIIEKAQDLIELEPDSFKNDQIL
jgi:hypothetical protein